MGIGTGLYMYDVVVKSSRSLSHLLHDEFLLVKLQHHIWLSIIRHPAFSTRACVILLRSTPAFLVNPILMIIFIHRNDKTSSKQGNTSPMLCSPILLCRPIVHF